MCPILQSKRWANFKPQLSFSLSLQADKEKKPKKKKSTKEADAPAAEEAPAPAPEPESAPVSKPASSTRTSSKSSSKKAKRSGSTVFSMFSTGQIAEFKEVRMLNKILKHVQKKFQIWTNSEILEKGGWEIN